MIHRYLVAIESNAPSAAPVERILMRDLTLQFGDRCVVYRVDAEPIGYDTKHGGNVVDTPPFAPDVDLITDLHHKNGEA